MADGITNMVEMLTEEKQREKTSVGRGRRQFRGASINDRGRWHDNRGDGGRGYQEGPRRDDQQERNQYYYGGRHMSTGRPRGGRSERGGQDDHRARPN
jgi:hypothetical protein